jgi:hypothetical protein
MTRSYGDDDWRITDSDYIKTWKEAVEQLAVRKVVANKVTYRATIDWRPMLRRHERHFAAMSYVYRKGDGHAGERLMKARVPARPSKIQIEASSDGKDDLLEHAVASMLYDVFVIMNIAAPGCCNFYRAELAGAKGKIEVSLSSSEFELGILPPVGQTKLPKISILPLERVKSWFDTVRPGINQVPANATEQAIFALLHITKLDIDPVSIVWLFYAFESLLKTKVGENFNSIVQRFALLLNISKEEVASLRKQLRVLYDQRSAIVHGGFKVVHPMRVDRLDDQVSNSITDLLRATGYGHTLLVAGIQQMVLNNWSELHFRETIDIKAV